MWIATVAAYMLFSSTAATAHHSFAMYDSSKLMTISGVVSSWDWSNPHIEMVAIAKTPTGDQKWELTGQSVSSWSRLGMHGGDIKVGDRVTIRFHPARSGANNGYVVNFTLPNGRTIGETPPESTRDSFANPLEAPK